MSALNADASLAARLETLAAAEMRRFAEAARDAWPGQGADVLDVAGGSAVFVSPGSPLNGTFGLGFAGEVSTADIDAIERFFHERGAAPHVSACPLADPSLLRALAEKGFSATERESVLVRDIVPGETLEGPADCVEVREAIREEDRSDWGLVAATGFSAPLSPLPEQLAIGALVAEISSARLFWAWVGDRAAGTGELHIDDDVAWLSADTTLPYFRGRGVQQSLQRHRLSIAVAQGCTLAVSETVPDSGSQRNMERAAFRLAYTRVEFAGPLG